jgi:DNA-binding GntR family transcriptional regulator
VLAPGEPIPELRLCEDLQISRTPLREALKVLAAEDYVALQPNRGSVVRNIVPEEIADVFVHVSALQRGGSLREGQKVTHEVAQDRRA